MATEEEIQRLKRIRHELAAIGPDLTIQADGNELRLCAADPMDGEIAPIAILLPSIDIALQNFPVHSVAQQRFLVDLLDRCARARQELSSRLQQQEERRQLTRANLCAIKCQKDQAFRRYLIECHDMPDAADTERVKVKVRSLLAIQSMAELDEDPAAAARWDDLTKAFNRWRRG